MIFYKRGFEFKVEEKFTVSRGDVADLMALKSDVMSVTSSGNILMVGMYQLKKS